MIQARIENIEEKKLVGKRLRMSLADNKTLALWQSFMPQRKIIANTINNDLFSMRVYDRSYDFKNFDFNATFDKWAATAVSNFDNVPDEFETFILPRGLYAVFHYVGLNTDPSIFQYIYGKWIPNNTEYELDNRPHFEVLDKRYKNNDLTSEEDIWIPIKAK